MRLITRYMCSCDLGAGLGGPCTTRAAGGHSGEVQCIMGNGHMGPPGQNDG